MDANGDRSNGSADFGDAVYSKRSKLPNDEWGIALLANCLQDVVRLSMNQVILNGKGVNDSAAALLLAANDIIVELQAFNGTSNLTAIALDAKQAKSITEKALQNFVGVFRANINKTLEGYYNEGETKDDLRAALCLKLLAVPEWPETIAREYCMGTKISSIFKKGPKSIGITEAIFDEPQEKRSCYFVSYLRNAMIYQNYQSKR